MTSIERSSDGSAVSQVAVVFLHMFPVIPIGWGALGSRGEYFFITQLGLASAFAMFSLGFALVGVRNSAAFWNAPSRAILRGTALAWLAAVLVLLALNLTPLCVGQDNGDGFNSLGMCVAYAGIVGTIHGTIAAVFALAAAGLAGVFRRG